MQKILRTREAAEYCGLAGSTFEKMRIRGDGPKFVRLSIRAIGYECEALDEWIATCRRSSTSDQGSVA